MHGYYGAFGMWMAQEGNSCLCVSGAMLQTFEFDKQVRSTYNENILGATLYRLGELIGKRQTK